MLQMIQHMIAGILASATIVSGGGVTVTEIVAPPGSVDPQNPPGLAEFIEKVPDAARIETVVLLSKLNAKQHIEVELNLDELDLTSAESKATYDEIKAYVLEKYGLKVSSLYISQIKRKCGLDVGQNYNLSKKEDAKVPQCPPEKEAAIIEALKHFQMI